MKKLKILLVSTALLTSAYLGDCYNVKDRFVEPIMYRNVKVDSKTYQKPFQLQKKYQVNEKGKLEVYIGCDKEWHKVSEELRVNERSLGEKLKDETKEIVPYIKKKVDDLVEWYNRSFGNGNPD
ncbi:MAG: hypothetical protein Q8O03_01750 [Nanoarchaeota archaeon]|nr:hypothetical protein [Nanoarchaeota archaeon]